ncbi:L-rhamnose-binding lectin SML-like [Vanacampus margaritifer]
MTSCFRLSAALLLTATCFLFTEVVDSEQMTTCDSHHLNVHQLNCKHGVISVQAALYGRLSTLVCNEVRPAWELANTHCAQPGVVDILRIRCNGKSSCYLNTGAFRIPDPCFGTFKYLQTNFTCVPAITVVACEASLAHLACGQGKVISILGADFGRRDRTTCICGRPQQHIENVQCLHPSPVVASRCNGKNSCSILASVNLFGDPCQGTYKYLEVAYTCH